MAGPAPLALYSRAYNLMLIPVQQSTQVLGRVLFPALALCGGVALAELARRGRAGHALAFGLLAVVVVRGAIFWYVQLATYQH